MARADARNSGRHLHALVLVACTLSVSLVDCEQVAPTKTVDARTIRGKSRTRSQVKSRSAKSKAAYKTGHTSQVTHRAPYTFALTERPWAPSPTAKTSLKQKTLVVLPNSPAAFRNVYRTSPTPNQLVELQRYNSLYNTRGAKVISNEAVSKETFYEQFEVASSDGGVVIVVGHSVGKGESLVLPSGEVVSIEGLRILARERGARVLTLTCHGRDFGVNSTILVSEGYEMWRHATGAGASREGSPLKQRTTFEWLDELGTRMRQQQKRLEARRHFVAYPMLETNYYTLSGEEIGLTDEIVVQYRLGRSGHQLQCLAAFVLGLLGVVVVAWLVNPDSSPPMNLREMKTRVARYRMSRKYVMVILGLTLVWGKILLDEELRLNAVDGISFQLSSILPSGACVLIMVALGMLVIRSAFSLPGRVIHCVGGLFVGIGSILLLEGTALGIIFLLIIAPGCGVEIDPRDALFYCVSVGFLAVSPLCLIGGLFGAMAGVRGEGGWSAARQRVGIIDKLS